MPVVGNSTGDMSVTTTDVITGIAESQVVRRCSGILPRCKFTSGGKCNSTTRVRTLGGCKPDPVREGAFVARFMWGCLECQRRGRGNFICLGRGEERGNDCCRKVTTTFLRRGKLRVGREGFHYQDNRVSLITRSKECLIFVRIGCEGGKGDKDPFSTMKERGREVVDGITVFCLVTRKCQRLPPYHFSMMKVSKRGVR